MAESLAGLVLGAGAGTRMRPLTNHLPKVLLPLVDRPLVDHALDRLRTVTTAIAGNCHHTQPALAAHLDDAGVHVSLESGDALGTAGAIAPLRSWLAGRGLLVVNGDTYVDGDLLDLVDGWDGRTLRVLVAGAQPFGPRSGICGSLIPAHRAVAVPERPAGLWELFWHDALAAGELEVVHHHGRFIDCATPIDLLAANLTLAPDGYRHPTASIGHDATVERSILSADCEVEGDVVDSVVFPGAHVLSGRHVEHGLVVRSSATVLVRRALPALS